jgi:signal transduction histidine kinase
LNKLGLKRLLPSSMFARLMWVWVLGLLLVLLAAGWVAVQERSQRGQAVLYASLVQEVAATADWLDTLTPEQRQTWRQENPRRQFRWRLMPPDFWSSAQGLPATHPLVGLISAEMPQRQPLLAFSRGAPEEGAESHSRRVGGLWLQLRLQDGREVYARLPERLAMPEVGQSSVLHSPGSPRWGLVALVVFAGLAVLTWVAVVYATRPLKQMTQAALQIAQNPGHSTLSDAGPTEVQQAARALNHMQTQIRQHVAERTQMLAAIAHDLQTPMTRLRLKTEWVNDEDLRTRMQADITQMQQLVQEGLSLARSWNAQPHWEKLDLVQWLEALQQEWLDSGWSVSCQWPSLPCVVWSDVQSLKRALSNVVHNAVLYGQCAHVRLMDEGNAWRITIDDEGSGIPPEALEAVLQPYVRLEGSRNRETGGTGLGLAIAHNLMQALGGSIRLSNRPEGGMRVELTAPKHRS